MKTANRAIANLRRQFNIQAYFLVAMLLTLFALPLPGKDKLPEVAADAIAPQDSLFHEPLSRGLQMVYEDRFQESIDLFDSLQMAYPDHPAPYFYKAATYQTWMSSYRFSKYQKELEENVQLAIDKGNAMLKLRKDDPWLNFYIGAAYGYRAFFRIRSFNWIGAYMDGKKGIGNFKKALKKEPSLYDVYLGLGSYHYWRTARSKFIRIVAFWMSDKRDFGLEQIDFSVRHGQYCPAEASLVHVTALYDYKKYDEALTVLDAFEQSARVKTMSSLYLRGRLMIQSEDWATVDAIFRELLTRLDNAPYTSIGYQVECKYWMAKAERAFGNSEAALALAREALLQSEQRDKDAELESQFESFNDIRDLLKDLKKSLEKNAE